MKTARVEKIRQVYVSDLDMTLLQPDSRLSPFAIANINNLVGKGVLFTVASARSVKSIQPLLDKVQLPLPVIEFNGSFISDLKTGEHLYINDLEKSAIHVTADILQKHSLNYFLSTFDNRTDKLHYIKAENPGEEWYVSNRKYFNDKRLNQVTSLSNHFAEKVVCFTAINRREILLPIIDELNSANENIEIQLQENYSSPGWYWLTVHSHLASKDQAISCLLKHCKLLDSRVTAFGDNTNDVKMIKSAHRGIAVENALQVLKDSADLIIGPNTEDSVVRYIADECGIELI